jgi:hypothetical protein
MSYQKKKNDLNNIVLEKWPKGKTNKNVYAIKRSKYALTFLIFSPIHLLDLWLANALLLEDKLLAIEDSN